jgi:hypothetical protein
MAHAELEAEEVEKVIAAEADVAAIPVRSDLPVGHWLAGRRAARVVWSGELDQVVVDGRLVTARTVAELAAAEKPIEEKPIEEKPAEEPIAGGEVVRVR